MHLPSMLQGLLSEVLVTILIHTDHYCFRFFLNLTNEQKISYQIGLCSARKNVTGSKSEIFIKVECKKVYLQYKSFI